MVALSLTTTITANAANDDTSLLIKNESVICGTLNNIQNLYESLYNNYGEFLYKQDYYINTSKCLTFSETQEAMLIDTYGEFMFVRFMVLAHKDNPLTAWVHSENVNLLLK